MELENLTNEQLAELREKIAVVEGNRKRQKMNFLMVEVQKLLKKYEISESELLKELNKRAKYQWGLQATSSSKKIEDTITISLSSRLPDEDFSKNISGYSKDVSHKIIASCEKRFIPILEASIKELELRTKLQNVLEKARINTVKDLLKKVAYLQTVPKLNKESIAEIEMHLALWCRKTFEELAIAESSNEALEYGRVEKHKNQIFADLYEKDINLFLQTPITRMDLGVIFMIALKKAQINTAKDFLKKASCLQNILELDSESIAKIEMHLALWCRKTLEELVRSKILNGVERL